MKKYTNPNAKELETSLSLSLPGERERGTVVIFILEGMRSMMVMHGKLVSGIAIKSLGCWAMVFNPAPDGCSFCLPN